MPTTSASATSPSRFAKVFSGVLLAMAAAGLIGAATFGSLGYFQLTYACVPLILASLFFAVQLSAAYFVTDKGIGVGYFGRQREPRPWSTVRKVVLNIVEDDERIAIVLTKAGQIQIGSGQVGFRPLVARLIREAESHEIEIVYAIGYINGIVGSEGDPNEWAAYLAAAELPVARTIG